ncbi:MAG TPA: YceI family protein [Vicinamibacterales bacterium]|nr:YceI family protein [Vicinamibacterales bacterium]
MSTATATPVRTFQIDKAHSEASFQVRHLLSKVRGQFTDFAGTIEFDQDKPERSTVSFTIQTASVDTNQADRDAHLRGDDFFAVDRFPTLTFTSVAITPKGGNEYKVEGDLTIRDVTRRIVVPVTHLGLAQDPWGNEKLAFEAEVTINRRDFGLTWNAALETGGFLVGDEVKVSLQIQAA